MLAAVPNLNRRRSQTCGLLLSLLSAFPATALELRVHPGAPLYLIDVDPRRGVQSAMVQNLAIVNPSGAPVALDQLRIEIRAGDRVRQTHVFDGADLDKAGARMAKLKETGALALYDFAFQTSKYLGAEISLAGSRVLPTKSALVLTGAPVMVRGEADSMRIVADGKDADGAPVQAALNVPLEQYRQKNSYRFPLNGVWLVAVGPSFSEPHRWVLMEEFALDVVRFGGSGKTCGGSCSKVTDYYGYGQDVLAAADGEVVAVESDQKESNDRFRQPGESGEAFLARTMEEQSKLLRRGAAGVGGNFVVVRHSGGEYSHYMHLAAGSVRVKRGDKVASGQALGKLGHTGNSTEPHLHFSVADGPDPLYARSLPVRYEGLTTEDGPQGPVYPQSGWIVESTPAATTKR